MRVALVNPPWSFDGSSYRGCREPHLALELGYARVLLEARGHEVQLLNAQLAGADLPALVNELASFRPEATVITTAPSPLFWRCAPPEPRVPIATARALRPHAGRLFAVGPHRSTTPGAGLRELEVDAVVLGECEQVLPQLIEADPSDYEHLGSIAFSSGASSAARERTGAGGRGEASPPMLVEGEPAVVDMCALPALRWSAQDIGRHRHQHHRFDRVPNGPGAELELSRGCPCACPLGARQPCFSRYRRRSFDVVLDELDALCASGARYVYFIDDAFLPDGELCEALARRQIEFGVQLRIDSWSTEMLRLLGRAGCVSIEAGVESFAPEGGRSLGERCKLGIEELTELLLFAKRHVPFVQANLIGTSDRPDEVAAWRARLSRHGVWSNEPVLRFPSPGSLDYWLRWGKLDEQAWERAHARCLQDTRRTRISGAVRRHSPLCNVVPHAEHFPQRRPRGGPFAAHSTPQRGRVRHTHRQHCVARGRARATPALRGGRPRTP